MDKNERPLLTIISMPEIAILGGGRYGPNHREGVKGPPHQPIFVELK